MGRKRRKAGIGARLRYDGEMSSVIFSCPKYH